MISPDDFVDFLEQKDLLPARLIASLRRQLAETRIPISAALVAKRLVDSGHLSPRLAQRLLEQAQSARRPRTKPRGPVHRDPKPSGELDLAPLDDEESERAARRGARRPQQPTAPDDLARDDDQLPLDEELAPLEEAVPPPDDYGLVQSQDYGLAPLEEESPRLVPIDDGPADMAPADDLVPLDDLIPLDQPAPTASRRPTAQAPSPPSGPVPESKPQSRPSSTPPVSPVPAKTSPTSRPKAKTPPPGGPIPLGAADMATPLELASDLSAAAGRSSGSARSQGRFDAHDRLESKRAKGNVWDSPLLLLGGGALLLLLILAGALLWAVMRQGGDALLKIADDDYAAGSYTKAIQDYSLFLEKAPKHPKANEAHIRRGLARIRQATDGSTNWSTALTATKNVLGDISSQTSFRSLTQGELAAMLPKIAEGLANQARKQPKEELVQQAEETLALVDKYLNKDVRPETKLAGIRALLALTRRDISRSNRLQETIAAMNKAVASRKTAEAYQVRHSLLKEYPDLGGNQKLQAATLAASHAEQAAVKSVAQSQAAETTAPATPALTTVALARRDTVKEVSAAKGWVVCALAGGAAYGMDAATGKVLWRRPVGFADNGRSPIFPPTPVANSPGSDLLLVDAIHNAVVRLRATDGQLCWRFPVGEQFDAYPVIDGNQLFIATRSGRLVTVDLQSGASAGFVQFPQELRTAPAVDHEHSAIFQIAEHSNLFVLSLADGHCTRVLYLGHEPGSVVFPPVVLGRFLVITRCDSSVSTALQVFTITSDKDGAKLDHLQDVRLKGRVTTTPLVSDRRLLAMTDTGELVVLEVSDADPSKPLSVIAQGVAGGEENLVRFPLLMEGQFFLGDSQLTNYDILASRGRLQSRWTVNQRSTTLQPLLRIGQAVFQVRRRQGLPGAAVSAVNVEDGKPLWETHLAAPLVAEPSYDASADLITAMTSSGGLFELKAADLAGSAVIDEPIMGLPLAEVRQPVTDAIRLERHVMAVVLGKNAHEVSIFHTSAPERRIRQLPLPDPLGGPTAALAGALVTPLQPGEVFLLDPFTGEKRTEAFQPSVQAGTSYAWQRPLIAASGELLLTDSRRAVYRVVVRESPKPYLAGEGTLDLSSPIVSPLAVAGRTGFAVTADGKLMSFTLPELKQGPTWSLHGRYAWGPWPVGDRVLAASSEQLLCVDASQQRWQVPLPSGPLVGAPLEDGGSLLLASADGAVCRLDASTGKQQAKVEIGQPLSTGPVALKDQIILGGFDGSIYQIHKP